MIQMIQASLPWRQIPITPVRDHPPPQVRVLPLCLNRGHLPLVLSKLCPSSACKLTARSTSDLQHTALRPPTNPSRTLLSSAMPSFPFCDPYPEKRPDSSGGPSDDEISFDIDSNVSDADLLKLRAELKKLQPEKIQRDLADATRALQELALQRWTQYGYLLVPWTSKVA